MKWWQISSLLCVYGFFHEYKPSQPFVVEFFTKFKHISAEKVNQEIFPVSTYTWLCLLIVVFLLTDYLRYKPVIIIGSLLGIIGFCLQAFVYEVWLLKLDLFFFGAFSACEVAYYTYTYSVVNKKYYQKVTSHARAAYMFGRSMGSISAQVFVSTGSLDYLQLHYVTIGSLIISLLVSFVLPSAPRSVYFHRQSKSTGQLEVDEQTSYGTTVIEKDTRIPNTNLRSVLQYLRTDFLDAYTNVYVVKWSLWWAFATCTYYQVTIYSQVLWTDIHEEQNGTLYNGYVEFAYTLIGSGSAFLMGFLNLQWNIYGECFLAVLSLFQGGLLLASAFLHSLIPVYVFYIVYGALYESAITIATSEVAKNIREDSYALVFGINMFLSLFVQSILVAIVLDGLKTDIRPQFMIYGGFCFVLGVGFTLSSLVKIWRRRQNGGGLK